MNSELPRNVWVLSICIVLGIFAIHGARMFLYFGVLGGGMSWSGLLGSGGVYVLEWLPPLTMSFLMGALMLLLYRAHFVRWALAYGVVIGLIWLLGTTHEYRGISGNSQAGLFDLITDYVGICSWYAMPLLGAWLGSRAARGATSRFTRSGVGEG